MAAQAEKKVTIGNYSIYANESHLIESYLSSYKFYSRNLPRIAKSVSLAYKDGSFIDVGANIGDSIALIRSNDCHNHIYAIEGDKNYFKLLEKNVNSYFKNVQPENIFLGEQNTSIQSDLVSLGGTLNIKQNSNSDNLVQIITLDEFVSLKGIRDLKLVKVDTDGFDFMILRGGLKTLEAQKPVLFFEYDEKFLKQNNEDGIETLVKLKSIGYHKVIYYDNFGRYLMAIDLDNIALLEDLYLYMSNSGGAFPYYDLCVFHSSDNALADQIIKNEREYFRKNG